MADPSHPLALSPAEGDVFELTEALLARDLAGGQSLREIAAQRGISYDTARSHLRAIMSKTAIHRQTDLVALLRASLGNLRV